MSGQGSFVEELMAIKGGAKRIPYDAERDRFQMPHCADTSINKELNANRIVVDGKNIAIATQYPYPHQVEAHLQMLLDNCTPVLIMLASATDIQNHQMPEYFSRPATYGNIQTRCKFVDYIELGSTFETKVFTLSISSNQASIDIPVLHVHNWPDQHTVGPEVTSKLVSLIESTVAESKASFEKDNHPAVGNTEKVLPVIHCKAGVGRTGQTLAAMVMKNHPELSLESITKDLRASRNDRMVQTRVQMETLIRMKDMHSAPKQRAPKAKRSFFAKMLGKT